jgi:hypothetical protein
MTLLWSVLLVGLSSAAAACDLPPLAAVPAPSGLSEEQRQAVKQDVSAYFEAMKVYTACVQAEIAAAGDDDAPTYTAVLVNRNKAAVAEAYAVLKAFGPYAPLPANPASEAALRRLIDEYARGEPHYDSMTPKAARVARRTERIGVLFPIEKIIPFEKLESVTFLSTNARGADVYLVKLGPGGMLWEIELTSDGKISHSLMQVCRKHGHFVDPLPSCLPPGYLSPDRTRELSIGDAGQ